MCMYMCMYMYMYMYIVQMLCYSGRDIYGFAAVPCTCLCTCKLVFGVEAVECSCTLLQTLCTCTL